MYSRLKCIVCQRQTLPATYVGLQTKSYIKYILFIRNPHTNPMNNKSKWLIYNLTRHKVIPFLCYISSKEITCVMALRMNFQNKTTRGRVARSKTRNSKSQPSYKVSVVLSFFRGVYVFSSSLLCPKLIPLWKLVTSPGCL